MDDHGKYMDSNGGESESGEEHYGPIQYNFGNVEAVGLREAFESR